MRSLDSVRSQIEKVDLKMKDLFIERMNLIKEVKVIKDELNLGYTDLKREDYLKNKLSSDLVEYKDLYLSFMDYIFKLSKELMND